MGKRKRAFGDGVRHNVITFDPLVIREWKKREAWRNAPPSSSVAAPQVFGLQELLVLILPHLSPQELLRNQRISKAFQRATQTLPIKQKLFLAPIEDREILVQNPFRGAAIPEWFLEAREWIRPPRDGETRIITFYETEEGKQAIKSSREEEKASWRSMLICQPPIRSIRVVQSGRTVKIGRNLNDITVGDVHDEIQFIRSWERSPPFRHIMVMCCKPEMEVKIDLIPYDH